MEEISEHDATKFHNVNTFVSYFLQKQIEPAIVWIIKVFTMFHTICG